MKLYRAILKNTSYEEILISQEAFTNKESVSKWFKDKVEFHERMEDHRQENFKPREDGRPFKRRPFDYVLMGVEPFHIDPL